MKRPVLITAAGVISGCILAAWQVSFWMIFAILTVIVCLTFKVLGKKILPLILYVFFLFVGILLMKNSMEIRNEMEAVPEDTLITVTGEIENIEESEYGYKIFIRIKDGICEADLYNSSINGGKSNCIINSEFPGNMIGNKVMVTGNKKNFKEALNYGNFNEKDYCYSKGIVLKINIKDIDITDDRTNEFKAVAYRIKTRFSKTLENICTEKMAGVFMAVIYGEKDRLDEKLEETFADGGISHILVVSGLHISIAGMGIYIILRRFLTGRWAGVISTIVMIMYVMIAGGSLSAFRALIMFSLQLLGKLTGRIYDMKNAVAIAALILIAQNPYYLFNSGFLLSFGTVAGIAFILPYVINFLKIKKAIVKSFVTSFTINIINGPVIANTYYELSLYSVFLNIIVLPLMSIVVLCGIIGIVAGQISDVAGTIIISPAVWVINFYELLCRLSLKLPFAKIVTGHFEIWQLVLYYGFVFALVSVMRYITKKEKIILKPYMKALTGIMAGIVLCIGLYISVPKRNVITFLNVGQGESSVFVSDNGMVCIFDAGSTTNDKCGTYNILPYLKYNGISHIDYIILSHSDEDHINGVKDIIDDNAIKVDNVIAAAGDEAFDELIEEISDSVNIIFGMEDMHIEDNTTRISFINPQTDGEETDGNIIDDVNERSIVTVIETNGRKIVITGDIGETTEARLVQKYGNTSENGYSILADADVLKVAHHGSKYSSTEEFLSLTSPKLAVISCSEDNPYGHPHRETLERLDKYAEKVEITYDTGAVTVYLDNSDTLTYDIFSKTKQ